MAKDKSAEDIISEQEYTMRMKSASALPENDSPGDSEIDSGAEFAMGIEYIPDPDLDSEEGLEDSLIESPLSSQTPEKLIPDSAKVVFSEQDAPWLDAEKDSSTH